MTKKKPPVAKASKKSSKSAPPAKSARRSAKTPPGTRAKQATTSAKKAAPAAATPKKPAPKRAAPPALGVSERQSLLKPPEAYATIVADTIDAWKKHSRTIRIEDRTPARLARALALALRARQREEQLREQMETRLRPLSDARLVAEDALWSQVLDLYRIVKANIPIRPELESSFDKLADHFARAPAAPKKEPDAPA